MAVKPFLSWVGGKRHLIQLTENVMSSVLSGAAPTRIFSPFIGAGAIELSLMGRYRHAELYASDINARLINTWAQVVANPERVSDVLRYLDKEGNRQGEIERLNAEPAPCTAYDAAAMIWLTKRSFSSLYRVNSKNEFNAAEDTVKRRPLPSLEDLKALSRLLLSRSLFIHRPFDAILPGFTFGIQEFREGDLIICDPPYLGTYDGYSGSAWSEGRLMALLKGAHAALEQGAAVLVYELSDTLIRYLLDNPYPGLEATVHQRVKSHFVNGAVKTQPQEGIAVLRLAPAMKPIRTKPKAKNDTSDF